ncbi:proline iminopeptidase-family hydrolase [Mucilaginibacter gynuensis]|uniref:Proline iminopeptidase-family hydrolase n=1 Tax=Mucilaginibacter gynuensis TaxID=1302236 RepID=A0ABP8G2W7_9SPHI
MKMFLYLAFAVLLAGLLSCNNQGTTVATYFAPVDSGVQAGGIKMVTIETPVGKFKVWTKRIGNNPRIKILLLHGGPATTHEYMECFESFFPKEGFEMIEYDQLGSYYSDQSRDSSLWTLPRFVDEVEQVRKALKLDNSNFYILGHSWGSMLGMEYALKYPNNLKGLIVGNMMASIPAYADYNKLLRNQMRPSLVDSLEGYEAKGLYQDSTYQALVAEHFYSQHLCRLPELPEPVARTFKHINNEIYVMMQGPSEFKTGGRLVNWDITARLKDIKVRTLTVGAKYDTMDPGYMEWMSKQMPHANYLYCPNGSHLAMWDDQQVYMNGIIKFIKDVDAGK